MINVIDLGYILPTALLRSSCSLQVTVEKTSVTVSSIFVHQSVTSKSSILRWTLFIQCTLILTFESLFEFVYLMEKSTIIHTDSGGIQEEASGLGKPVLVMRDTTERPEALSSGTVHLVGTNYDKILSEGSILLDDQATYDKMSKAINPYGDGLAYGRIVDALKQNDI